MRYFILSSITLIVLLVTLPSYAKTVSLNSLHTSQSFQPPPAEKKKKKVKLFKKKTKKSYKRKSKGQPKEQQDFLTIIITVAILFLYLIGILLTILGLYYALFGLSIAGIILLGIFNLVSAIFGGLAIVELNLIPQFIALSGIHLLTGIPILVWGIMLSSTLAIGTGIGLLVFFLIFLIFLIINAINLAMLS